ncbi:MAG: substrate-binding domain-containing protein [Gammaproteobacteria bacterium]|nr:substrate-binding domain-containing protein [Gammaproteobacteria bacterium]MDH5801984.1 substrate-binding domain-containing protein [Gammaproteobacteria bacterium]
MKTRYSYVISIITICAVLLFTGSANSNTDKTPLMGAGAHFAWIVFDALKPELEKATGRDIILFGENSMLGVGCNAGIKAAKQNSPTRETFGFVCCPLSPEEISKNNLKVYPLAYEPILILTNSNNPVKNITKKQVQAVFRGDIINWKQIGGSDTPIVVVTRLHCKDRPGHWKTILPDADQFRQERLNVKSAAAMVQRVSDFKSAIGHTGSTWKFKKSDKIKVLTVDGIAPTAENLRNGKYPFFRRLSAVTDAKPSPDVVKLIKSAQTGAAFKQVAKQYNLLPFNKAPAGLVALDP